MKHKIPLLLAGLVVASTLSSCVVAPVPVGPGPRPVAVGGPRSPYSPGGRYVTPGERYARSPYSPGGRYVTPRERFAGGPYSPGGVVVLPSGARPVVYRGVSYHTYGNTWYRPSGTGYVVVARPY